MGCTPELSSSSSLEAALIWRSIVNISSSVVSSSSVFCSTREVGVVTWLFSVEPVDGLGAADEPGVEVGLGADVEPGAAGERGAVDGPDEDVGPRVDVGPGAGVESSAADGPGVDVGPCTDVEPGAGLEPGVGVEPGAAGGSGAVVGPGVADEPGVDVVGPGFVSMSTAFFRSSIGKFCCLVSCLFPSRVSCAVEGGLVMLLSVVRCTEKSVVVFGVRTRVTWGVVSDAVSGEL